MSAVDRLAEIQARADKASDGPWEPDGSHFWTPSGRSDFHLDPADVKFIVAARDDVPRLVAALRAVLDLHKPHPATCSALYPIPLCDCDTEWPCPTVRAVEAALGEGQ